MTPRELIHRLGTLSKPDRTLDGELGKLIGYTRRFKVDIDPATGEQRHTPVWDAPNGGEARMPQFTKLIHDAHLLAQALFPDSIGGASWDEVGGAARIDAGRYVTAANPAIAICIAALEQMDDIDAGDEGDDESQEDAPD
ncbi:hypothetical protein ADU59_23950 [Pararhizobium polonicum]|uniref:Uncharacterized protein n=2 Tax=Pararhizobium polonicum TaxID=1612624 RepID=A0A1C7NVT7_9HYPH|nr:hypothetical protein ADU59_23950 [Pararhizobium polonicum]